MRTEGFRDTLLSTVLIVSLIASAISLLFTGPASASNPNGWGISYYADNSSDSYMAKAIISSATPYEHIILIVVDGMRADVLVEAYTPNIDNLTASGSFTWNAWTVTPSVTIAAIPSIFTGATPEVHGVTDWDGEIYAETFVEVFEEAGLPCAIVGEDPILGGYSATYCTGYYSHSEADENFTSTAIEWFIEYRPFLLTLYNPMPDRRGHAYGHSSPEYREAIEDADYHIGRLVENLKELGVYEDTLIVITTDHGMTGTSHGRGYATDMRVFSVWHGPGVNENYQMVDNVYIPASGNYDETYVAHRIIDIAPTITSLVGLRAPENSEGNIIYQIKASAIAAWRLIETWTGTLEAPIWQLIETWTGTIENPSWTGTAVFGLVNLYTVNVEKILDLYAGSKLVVKFYTYGDTFENENVIESFVPPAHVEENESARHPEGIGVKKARLDLTTNDTGNVISTIASFTVTKLMLETRFSEIPLEWALTSPAESVKLEAEFMEIPTQWALAPA